MPLATIGSVRVRGCRSPPCAPCIGTMCGHHSGPNVSRRRSSHGERAGSGRARLGPALPKSASPKIIPSPEAPPFYPSSPGAPQTHTFSSAFGLATDGLRGYYMSDISANRVVRIFANSSTVTVLGVNRNGGGFSGDGGPGTAALLSGVSLISEDGAGGVFVADRGNNIVRQLLSNGTVIRVAGNLTAGWSGDGGGATSATLRAPQGVAWDNRTGGGVWIADTGK